VRAGREGREKDGGPVGNRARGRRPPGPEAVIPGRPQRRPRASPPGWGQAGLSRHAGRPGARTGAGLRKRGSAATSRPGTPSRHARQPRAGGRDLRP